MKHNVKLKNLSFRMLSRITLSHGHHIGIIDDKVTRDSVIET